MSVVVVLWFYPVSTRRRFDVHTTSITLKRRRMDVKTTSCAYWVTTLRKRSRYRTYYSRAIRLVYRGRPGRLKTTLHFAERHEFFGEVLSMTSPPNNESKPILLI